MKELILIDLKNKYQDLISTIEKLEEAIQLVNLISDKEKRIKELEKLLDNEIELSKNI